MNKNFLFLFFVLLIPLVVGWTPTSNINLWDYYNITNGSSISADDFLQDGNLVIDNVTIANASVNYSSYSNSSTYWDGETSQADLNVNSSSFWASVSSFLTRWFYDDGNVLSFNETRMNATIDTISIATNASMKTYVDTQDNTYNTSMKDYGDGTYLNQSEEGNLNVNSSTFWAGVSSFSSRWFDNIANVFTFNETLLNSTIDDKVTNANDSMKTYVDTQDDALNASLKSYGHANFITQANESNLDVNSSDYWDDRDTASDLNNAVLSQADNVTYDGTETVEKILDDVLNYCVLDTISVTDDGLLQISWTSGEIFDQATSGVVDTDAGSANLTNNLPNYLLWNAGSTLTVSTTRANTSQIEVAHISVQSNDIWDVHEESICSEREHAISDGMANILPVIITNGLIVSENTDATYAFDVEMTSGVFYHDGHEKHTLSAIFTNVSNMTRWYHNSSGEWVSDSNPQMNSTHYDNGSQLLAVSPANEYTRSVFFVDDSRLHWVYGNVQYSSVGAATAGTNPIIPPGFIDIDPTSTALVIVASAAALPTAGGDQWIDARPVIGAASSGGSITDHGNLAGLADDDHTQYLRTDGTRSLSAGWDAGLFLITALRFNGIFNWTMADNFLSFNGTVLTTNVSRFNDSFQTEINPNNCTSDGDFMKGVFDNGTVDCGTPAGSGDITAVRTNNSDDYLQGGGETGVISLGVNTTTFDSAYWNKADGVSVFVNRTLWTSIDNYPSYCVSPDIMRGINDTLNCVTPDATAQCTGDVCGGGHTHPASEVTTGTFGTGNYVFDGLVQVQNVTFENDPTNHSIYDNSSTIIISGDTASLFIH